MWTIRQLAIATEKDCSTIRKYFRKYPEYLEGSTRKQSGEILIADKAAEAYIKACENIAQRSGLMWHLDAYPSDSPTDAKPGTEQKLARMAQRAIVGLEVMHDEDAPYEASKVDLKPLGGRPSKEWIEQRKERRALGWS